MPWPNIIQSMNATQRMKNTPPKPHIIVLTS
jgi:hypothetical protein